LSVFAKNERAKPTPKNVTAKSAGQKLLTSSGKQAFSVIDGFDLRRRVCGKSDAFLGSGKIGDAKKTGRGVRVAEIEA
jgi:hypothetical protein